MSCHHHHSCNCWQHGWRLHNCCHHCCTSCCPTWHWTPPQQPQIYVTTTTTVTTTSPTTHAINKLAGRK